MPPSFSCAVHLLPPLIYLNQCRVLFAILTRVSIMGTSVNTPTTVANAAPDSMPKSEIAIATASSKKLLVLI